MYVYVVNMLILCTIAFYILVYMYIYIHWVTCDDFLMKLKSPKADAKDIIVGLSLGAAVVMDLEPLDARDHKALRRWASWYIIW